MRASTLRSSRVRNAIASRRTFTMIAALIAPIHQGSVMPAPAPAKPAPPLCSRSGTGKAAASAPGRLRRACAGASLRRAFGSCGSPRLPHLDAALEPADVLGRGPDRAVDEPLVDPRAQLDGRPVRLDEHAVAVRDVADL